MYAVFVRDWWVINPSWPNGVEPCLGHRKYIHQDLPSMEEARRLAAIYNKTHDPGPRGRKAEVEEQ